MAHRVSSRPKKSEQKSVKVEEIDLITRKPQKSHLHLLQPPPQKKRSHRDREEREIVFLCVRARDCVLRACVCPCVGWQRR